MPHEYVPCRYSTPGGYSCKAVRPIALAKVMSIAQMMKAEFPGQGKSLSGIGGVETGNHAAEFILLGASTVQVRIIPLLQSINLENQLSLFQYITKPPNIILDTRLMICLPVHLLWT